MRSGAETPEELETLLEDAFVTRDREALAALFDEEAVFAAADRRRHARGGEDIARFAEAMWQAERTFVAEPRQVVQAGRTALLVAAHSINVARRRRDGTWRYAISLLSLEHDEKEEQ